MPNKKTLIKRSTSKTATGSKAKSKQTTKLPFFGFSKKARMITFMLLFANIASIGLLITNAATAGLSNSKEADQLYRMNSYRASNGRAGYGSSACLAGIARSWSMQMGQRNKLAHSNDTGSGIYNPGLNYAQQVPAQCGGAWQKVGENVGYGYDSGAIFNSFVASSAHRANILSDFTHVGIGAYVASDGKIWVTQIFAKCPGCGSAYTTAPRNVGEPGSNLRDTLTGGQKLTSGQSIFSKNGSYHLVMQSDGNLVIYRYWGGYLWYSRTNGSTGAYAIFQTDGNLVVYRSGKHACHSGTYGRGGKSVSLGGDGNLVIYTGTGAAIWASKSNTWYC